MVFIFKKQLFNPMKRTNLLISPVGKNALDICQGWTLGKRNYDVMLIYYDADDYQEFKKIADYFVLTKGFKYPLLAEILSQNIELLSKYAYFFFPDDDVRMSSKEINKLFRFSKKQKINICQPSLFPENCNWPITQHNPNTQFRYVSLVEIMCPLFSQHALKKCLPSFSESYSGWGLEAAWYRCLGSRDDNFIVYDLVRAKHEGIRAMGSKMYDNLKAMGVTPVDEFHALRRKYQWNINFYDIRYVYRPTISLKICWNKITNRLRYALFSRRKKSQTQ